MAGFVEAGSGGATMTGADGEPCTTTGCADDSTGIVECTPPSPSPCSVAGDPLRALGVACYDGVSNATLDSPDPDAWRLPREFGNAFWTASGGGAMVAITTGRLPAVGATGLVVLSPGLGQPGSANGNPDQADAPPLIEIRPGSNGGAGGTPFSDCDGTGDCSDTLQGAWAPGVAHDLVWLSFDASVPAGVRGYAVRVALLTAEYPERVGSATSDTFVWWATSERYTGNLATVGTAAATVLALTPDLMTYTGDHPALLQTGMDGLQPVACTVGEEVYDPCPTGAATAWLELRGPVVPGETVNIVVALFDHGDDQLDTTVLLDDWRWECEGCTPGVDCGLHST